MRPAVVTLFETYGSGARYVGPRVAEALAVPWLDQAFSSSDIESAKYPSGGRATEHGSGLARLLGRFATGAALLDDAAIPLAQAQDAELVQENTRTVRAAADAGVVMLGRNGALILNDYPNALHVRLDAPVAVRVARAAREEGIDEALASRRRRLEDQVRVEMSERLYYWNPLDLEHYHLVINTGMVELDAAVEFIVAASRATTSGAS